MASEPILAVHTDIDDQIVEFCNGFPMLEPAAVVRDIARIVCIANLVRNGTLDGKNMVLRAFRESQARRCRHEVDQPTDDQMIDSSDPRAPTIGLPGHSYD